MNRDIYIYIYMCVCVFLVVILVWFSRGGGGGGGSRQGDVFGERMKDQYISNKISHIIKKGKEF
jgi:preprotein translocase subunit SecG